MSKTEGDLVRQKESWTGSEKERKIRQGRELQLKEERDGWRYTRIKRKVYAKEGKDKETRETTDRRKKEI